MARLLLLLSMLVGFATAAECQQKSQTALERFKKEAKAAWDEYGARKRKPQASRETSIVVNQDGNEYRQTNRSIVKQNQTGFVWSIESMSQQGFEAKTIGSNSSYTFHLTKGEEKGGWRALTVEERKPGTVPRFAMYTHEELAICHASPQFAVNNKKLQWLVSQPTFQAVEARIETRGTNEFIQIVFAINPDAKTKRFFPVKSGVLLFDPACLWCLKEIDLDLFWGEGVAKHKQCIEYRVEDETCPVIERSVSDISFKGNIVHHMDDRYQASLTDQTPDADFTLSAFGLPEPLNQTPAPTNRNWLWLILAGMATIALVYMIRQKIFTMEQSQQRSVS